MLYKILWRLVICIILFEYGSALSSIVVMISTVVLTPWLGIREERSNSTVEEEECRSITLTIE